MSVEVTVPELGESIVEATVGQWLKHEGQSVAAGESLVTLETDKVNVEVAAPAAGVLGAIARHEGETVAAGDVLATIEEQAETAQAETAQAETAQAAQAVSATGREVSAAAAPAPATPAAPAPAATPAAAGADEPEARAGRAGEAGEAGEAQRNGDVRATPLARRLADEHGVDLTALVGSGAGGRVTHDDVAAYLSRAGQREVPATQAHNARSAAPSLPQVRQTSGAQPAPTLADSEVVSQPAAAADGALSARREERVRMSRRRLTIARRLVEAQQTAAMLTTFNEVDMSAIMELRARRREAFKERNGVSLGFMSFFTRAVIGALKVYPRLNAEIQGDEMVLKRYYDIGIAVATDEGLVVPVVRDADRLSFAAIERQVAELAARARSGTLGLAELRGGTFTITNGGTFGSLLSTPILNVPQVGILGMHKIEERPIAVKGQVVIHPMMYVALTYDHRIVDGSEAVGFLVRVKELLEDPEALLLEA